MYGITRFVCQHFSTLSKNKIEVIVPWGEDYKRDVSKYVCKFG